MESRIDPRCNSHLAVHAMPRPPLNDSSYINEIWDTNGQVNSPTLMCDCKLDGNTLSLFRWHDMLYVQTEQENLFYLQSMKSIGRAEIRILSDSTKCHFIPTKSVVMRKISANVEHSFDGPIAYFVWVKEIYCESLDICRKQSIFLNAHWPLSNSKLLDGKVNSSKVKWILLMHSK